MVGYQLTPQLRKTVFLDRQANIGHQAVKKVNIVQSSNLRR